MNKKLLSIVLMISGLLFFVAVPQTQAGTIWIFAGVEFDAQAEEVGGFGATYITYDLYQYYDPAVHGILMYKNPTEFIDQDGGAGTNSYLYGYYPGFFADFTTDDYRPNKLLCTWTEHALRPIDTPIPYQGQSYDPYNIERIVPGVYLAEEETLTTQSNYVSNNLAPGNHWIVGYLHPCIFTPTVASVTFVEINSQITTNPNKDLGNGVIHGGGKRIFPGKQSHNDGTNRKTVKVKAQLGDSKGSPPFTSGIKVYFRNFDVDDPASNTTVDSNGTFADDNRAATNKAGTFSNCTATSNGCYDETDSNGVAEATFTVTMQPGDNFVIAAGTDDSYVNGVSINGTGLEDSANQSLPTSQAKRTDLLTVWRKVHLEVDSMTTAGNNLVTGRIQDAITIGTTPVWVDVGTLNPAGDLEPSRFQGGELTSGTYRFQVVDNTIDQVQIKLNSGTATLFYNAVFQLFDDDDFNSNDGSPPGDGTLDGDDGKVSTENFENPFADAYVEPSYTWAEGQSDMNDENVPFRPEINFTSPTFLTERPIVNENRDSTGMEQDDFWIGYILIGYQAGTAVNNITGQLVSADGDPSPFTTPTVLIGGVSPTPTTHSQNL